MKGFYAAICLCMAFVIWLLWGYDIMTRKPKDLQVEAGQVWRYIGPDESCWTEYVIGVDDKEVVYFVVEADSIVVESLKTFQNNSTMGYICISPNRLETLPDPEPNDLDVFSIPETIVNSEETTI